MSEPLVTTWDGLPVSPEPPFGASIVVYRRRQGQTEILLLHRAHHGAAYEGDWAWTTPAGSRLPQEDIEVCARRELREETGLDRPLQTPDIGGDEWAAYAVEVDARVTITLDAEHDRYEWVDLHTALTRCQPVQVSDTLRRVLVYLNLIDANEARA